MRVCSFIFPYHDCRYDTKSIQGETHQKAQDILAGRKIDPTFYPVIYGADESDDWTDPKVGKRQTLGITVGIDKVKPPASPQKTKSR